MITYMLRYQPEVLCSATLSYGYPVSPVGTLIGAVDMRATTQVRVWRPSWWSLCCFLRECPFPTDARPCLVLSLFLIIFSPSRLTPCFLSHRSVTSASASAAPIPQCGRCAAMPCIPGQLCLANPPASLCPPGSYCPDPTTQVYVAPPPRATPHPTDHSQYHRHQYSSP